MLNFEYIRRSLANQTFLTELIFFEEIDSTNNYAKTLKGKDNVLVIADHQAEGRGRFENKWHSSKSENLTFTIRKKFDIERNYCQIVNFFFSYFTLYAIENFTKNTNLSFELKWPNDILLNGKKLCGLLIESTLNTNFFCIGIGINVNQKEFPDELSLKATSLKNETELEISNENLFIDIIKSFNDGLQLLNNKNYDYIHQLWKSKCKMIGSEIRFTDISKTIKTAILVDISIDGGIKLFFDEKEHFYHNSEIRILPSKHTF